MLNEQNATEYCVICMHQLCNSECSKAKGVPNVLYQGGRKSVVKILHWYNNEVKRA